MLTALRCPSGLTLPLLSALLLITAACGGDEPLAFLAQPIKIRHDGNEVFDAVLVDPNRNGRLDIVAASQVGLHYLEAEEAGWFDATLGTKLEQVTGSTRRVLVLNGLDLLAEKADGELVRLVYTGIGSWDREPFGGERPTPDPLVVEVDLNADGRIDRAHIANRKVHIELRDPSGALRDVTSDVGSDAVTLRADGRRLLAGDVDADGDMDLVAVGGRLFVLLNNGGVFGWQAEAKALTDGDETGKPAPSSTMPGPWFVDGTKAAGLTFQHREGGEQWDIRPTMGPGAAWADVDNDGDEDLYVVGGDRQRGALFINDGAGHFEDRSQDWWLTEQGAGMGAAFADYDNDGDPDLYITRRGRNLLYRNDGNRFIDVTEMVGVGDERWGAGIAWADFDMDGDLDLFVTNYLEFDETLIPKDGTSPALRREDPIAMLPYVFPGQTNILYRNDGGIFTDITEAAGLANPDGKSLGAIVYDHDGDGRPDLYVSNDTTPNTLWHNKGVRNGIVQFEEIGLFTGLDDPRGGMGVAMRDLDGDRDEELFVTYWQTEPNGLYRNNEYHFPTERKFVPRFEDITVRTGLAGPSLGVVGWGVVLDDLDNDGDIDVFVANGYTSPDYETTMTCLGQRNQLFENVTVTGTLNSHQAVPRFALVGGPRAGPPFSAAWASRGVAAADADGDGDLDLVVTNNNGPLVFLRNESGGTSLRVILEGMALGNTRDALGARVTLHLDDGSQRTAVVRIGSSYLSGHESGVRFGLGDRRAERIEIEWSETHRTSHRVPAYGVFRIAEPPL